MSCTYSVFNFSYNYILFIAGSVDRRGASIGGDGVRPQVARRDRTTHDVRDREGAKEGATVRDPHTGQYESKILKLNIQTQYV